MSGNKSFNDGLRKDELLKRYEQSFRIENVVTMFPAGSIGITHKGDPNVFIYNGFFLIYHNKLMMMLDSDNEYVCIAMITMIINDDK